MNKSILLIFLLASQVAFAQSLVGSAGASSDAPTYTISWSLGELAVNSLSGTSYTLTQGLHQGIYIEPLSTSDRFAVEVYPNPASNWLVIRNKPGDQSWSFQLMNLEGKSFFEKNEISKRDEKVDLSGISDGIYLMRITQGVVSTSYRIVIKK